MSDQIHISEISHFDEDLLKLIEDLKTESGLERANIKRFLHPKTQRWIEVFDWVDQDGVVQGFGLSTNVDPPA